MDYQEMERQFVVVIASIALLRASGNYMEWIIYIVLSFIAVVIFFYIKGRFK